MTDCKIPIKKEPKHQTHNGRAVAFTVGENVDRGELQERARRGVPESILQRQKERDDKRKERLSKERSGEDDKERHRSSKSKRDSGRTCAPRSPVAETPTSHTDPPHPVSLPSAAVLEAGGIDHDVRDVALIGVLSADNLPPPLPDPCPHPAEVDAALTTFGEVEIGVGDGPDAPLFSAGDLIARALVSPVWGHRALVPTLLVRALEAVGATPDESSLDDDSLALALRTCGALAAKLCDDSVLYVLRAGVAVVETALAVCVRHLAAVDLTNVDGAGEGGIAALATLALSDVANSLTKRLVDTSASARSAATDGLHVLANNLDLPVGVAAAGAICDLANISKVPDKELRARISWVHALVEEHGYDDAPQGAATRGLTQDAVTALAVAGLHSSKAEVRAVATDVIKQAMRRNALPTSGTAAAAGGGLKVGGVGLPAAALSPVKPAGTAALTAAAAAAAAAGSHAQCVNSSHPVAPPPPPVPELDLFREAAAADAADAAAAMAGTVVESISSEQRAAQARHTLGLIRVDAALAGQLAPAQLKALAASVNVPIPSVADWGGEYGPLLLTAAAAEAKDDLATVEGLAPEVAAALEPEAAVVGAVNVACALSKQWQLRANAARRMAVAVCAAVTRVLAVRDIQQHVHSQSQATATGARSGRRRIRGAAAPFMSDCADLDGLSFDRMAQLLSRLLGDSVPAVFAAAATATARIMALWASRGVVAADAVITSPATCGLVRDMARRVNNLSEPERAAAHKAIGIIIETKALGVRAMADFVLGPLLDSSGWRGGASHLDVLRKCLEEDPSSLSPPRERGRARDGRDPLDTTAGSVLGSTAHSATSGGAFDDATSPMASPGVAKTSSSGCLPVDAVFAVCRSGAESRHVRVRESAVAVLADLVRLFGPQVRSLLQHLKPAVLAEVRQRAGQRHVRSGLDGSISGAGGSMRLNVGDMNVISPLASTDRPRTESQRLPFETGNDEFGVLSDFANGTDFHSVRPSTVGDSPFTDFLASMSASPSGGLMSSNHNAQLLRGRKVFG